MSNAGKTRSIADTTTPSDGDTIVSYLSSASALLTSVAIGGNEHLRTTNPSLFAEDTAHASGDYGAQVLAVRNDAGTSLVSADGDYSPLQVDSTGALRVAASLTANFDFVYAEDSAHSSGDQGAFVMGVRNDSNTALTSADGDYSPIAVDSAGRLKTIAAGVYAEDAAASSGDTGSFILSVRRDAAGVTSSADGDYSEIQTNNRGEVRVANKAESTVLQQIVTVGTTAVALPTTPLAGRKTLMVQMLNSGQLYLGSSTVTNSGATRGFQLGNGGYAAFDIGGLALYGVANAANKDVAVLEMA